MSGQIQSSKKSSKELFLKPMKGKFAETPAHAIPVRGVYESTPHIPPTENGAVEMMLADIISRLDRIEEKINENVYPHESAIKPAFVKRVKKAQADIAKGKGKTYESMDAFIKAISE
jgi:hypothetical protein